jgi:hypothetical protein
MALVAVLEMPQNPVLILVLVRVLVRTLVLVLVRIQMVLHRKEDMGLYCMVKGRVADMEDMVEDILLCKVLDKQVCRVADI